MRVLILEDEPLVMEMLCIMLEKPGVDIDEAKTCQEAIRLLGENSYDCVTVDIRLPDGSGIDILKKIHTNHPDTRTVVLSGNIDEQVREEALSLGASAVFSKPFASQEIEEFTAQVHG